MLAPGQTRVSFLTKKQREENTHKAEAEKRAQEAKLAAEHRKRRHEVSRLQEEARDKRARLLREEKEKEERRKERIRNKSNEEQEVAIAAESSLQAVNMLQVSGGGQTSKEQQAELDLIKRQYLGRVELRKKVIKPSDKFRNIFNFEWDVSEDTSKDEVNDLYKKRLEPQLLFGRGLRGGIDVREQKRNNNFYEKLADKRAELGDLPEEIAKNRAAAKSKDGKMSYQERLVDLSHREKGGGHWKKKKKEDMTERDWRIFREDFQIFKKGGRVSAPMRFWEESGLPRELLSAVEKVGYKKPTPIQMQAIPIALDYRDMIGIAETGSGKTAAFMLPMLTYVKALPPLDATTSQDGPYALVMAPSRELALQIEEEANKFAHFCPSVQVVALVGGHSLQQQSMRLQQGCEVVIATPGRLADALESTHTVLNQCNYVVLDEADRMVEAGGFEAYVHRILDAIPSSNMKSLDEDQAFKDELEAKAGHRKFRITHMFSATMTPPVEKIARKFLRHPAYISVGDPGAGKRDIEQNVYWVDESQKRKKLQELLSNTGSPIIVFVNIKALADRVGRIIEDDGYKVSVLHGGKMQESRDAAYDKFKKGQTEVLVATDVAGRGLDVQGVKHVINFDMPSTIEHYTHRIGRTGRAGLKGKASSMVTKDDEGIMYDLRNFLIHNKQIVPQELEHCPAAKIKPGTVVDQRRKDMIKYST